MERGKGDPNKANPQRDRKHRGREDRDAYSIGSSPPSRCTSECKASILIQVYSSPVVSGLGCRVYRVGFRV